jgi:hypothetical protein
MTSLVEPVISNGTLVMMNLQTLVMKNFGTQDYFTGQMRIEIIVKSGK